MNDDLAVSTQSFWDERYAGAGAGRVWSGRPNPRLVELVSGLAAGSAADVGCGEGADAVWLAGQGWRVTGLDVSAVAVDRARGHAEEAGVADRTSFLRFDLTAGEPLPGTYDLVTAQFLHLPESAFTAAYRRMAAAVRPGGVLLVAGHHPDDEATGLRNVALAHLLFTPRQVTSALDPEEWDVEVADAPTREETRDGRTATVTDTVVLARRRRPPDE